MATSQNASWLNLKSTQLQNRQESRMKQQPKRTPPPSASSTITKRNTTTKPQELKPTQYISMKRMRESDDENTSKKPRNEKEKIRTRDSESPKEKRHARPTNQGRNEPPLNTSFFKSPIELLDGKDEEISEMQNSLPVYSDLDELQQIFTVPTTVPYHVSGLNSTSCATSTTLGLATNTTNTTSGLATNTTNTTLGQSQYLPFGRAPDNNASSSNVRDDMMKQFMINQMTLENQIGTLSKDLIFNINALYAKVNQLEKNIETLKNHVNHER